MLALRYTRRIRRSRRHHSRDDVASFRDTPKTHSHGQVSLNKRDQLVRLRALGQVCSISAPDPLEVLQVHPRVGPAPLALSYAEPRLTS